jgi:proteasome assembly chaperone (PAC2) family protein
MTVDWREAPALRRPILVVAFEGWFDVAEAATGGLRWLADRHDAETVAEIDAEPYFDFTARRPEVRMIGNERHIFWPDNRVQAVLQPSEPHDLLLLAGVEPHLHLQGFCGDLLEVVRRYGVELVITVGSLPEATPHTRPHPVKASSTHPDLAARLGLEGPSYQGPTGLVGVLHDALDRAGVPVISLRVGVPHYVTGVTNPKGQRALLAHLQHVTGVTTSFAELDETVARWEEQVSEAVADDSDATEFVQRLEAQRDRQLEQALPSGDDLAAEFERFLQERRDED